MDFTVSRREGSSPPSRRVAYVLAFLTCSSVVGLLMCGGDEISAYVPDMGIKEILREHEDNPIWKLRYVRGFTGKEGCLKNFLEYFDGF